MLSEKKSKWLIRAGIALPILFIFYFVYRYGITVPFWDEWEFVPVLEKFHNHTLTLRDFWEQHNEHRLFFPRILMLLMTRTFGWNIFLELCVNIILAAINLYLLFSIIDDTQDSKKNAVLKIVVSLLVFSMIQYENWTWGWTIQIYMAMTGIITAIWSINKLQGQMRGLVIAIIAGIFANYSFAAGLLIWPSIFFMLVIQKKWKLKHIIIWTVAGTITVTAFYYKHTGSSFDTPMTYFLSHPIIFSKYILCYLGSPLAHVVKRALWTAGILILIIILSILDIRRLDKKRFDKLVPWLALLVFVVLSAFITALGRVGLGIEQALSSRYTTISSLFVISAFVLLYNSIVLNLERKKTIKDIVFIAIVSGAFIFLYAQNYRFGISEIKRLDQQVNKNAFLLKDPEQASDEELNNFYPVPEIVRKRVKILSELGIKFNSKK